ncbi:MAG TPA: zinc ribbon domain-containing protein, partial [Armatimonadota bacterium]|nr:zinc ribbon domain-containing protein [Armatimonadota bacterium]
MIRCIGCGSPNRPNSTACYACGEPLSQVGPPSTPAPVLCLRPCTGCGQNVPAYHTACPGCGAQLGVWRGDPEPVPPGWLASAEPDGAIRLRPDLRARRVRSVAAVFGAVFIGWMCLRLIASRGGSGLGTGDELVMQVIAGTIVVCVLALAAATLLWALFGQEEWRMAPDVLEL